ncbi:coiled-coil domain-containing protein 158-like [Vanessa tameamea]|uniref:Coiled-coil domain-containing protein 158-like n=1 Tax=Vanessa tameamea TaxID=334116 RepID=A0A8B8I131_VANTA|nr:coiled-coil domain-containing protein 158-like [Vanessa tameamea]
MFSPADQQVEICLLKSNLEEIENDLVAQRSAIPALDAENEQKYRETMTALRVARSLNTEIERLKQESVRLTAKRMQLKRQSEEVSGALERARLNRSELEDSLKQEERDTELGIRRYEDTLRELADRFRKSRSLYNEEEMNTKQEVAKETNSKLLNEETALRREVSELKKELSDVQADVPEDILSIIGQIELEKKLKSLSAQCDSLRSERDYLLKTRPGTSTQQFTRKY